MITLLAGMISGKGTLSCPGVKLFKFFGIGITFGVPANFTLVCAGTTFGVPLNGIVIGGLIVLRSIYSAFIGGRSSLGMAL